MRLWDAVKASAEGIEDDGSYEAPDGPTDCERRRAAAMNLAAEELNLPTDWGDKPYGVVVEVGGSQGVTTMIAFADGRSSLFRANGSGMIGQPNHVHVVIQARKLVEAAADCVSALTPIADYPYPAPGRMRFYALTGNGVLSAEEDLASLREGHSALSPLLDQADELKSEFLQYLVVKNAPLPPSTAMDWFKVVAMVAIIAGLTYAAWLIPIAWLRWPAMAVGVFFTIAALIVPYAMLTARSDPGNKEGQA